MKKTGLFIICILILNSCGNKHKGERKTTLLSNLLSITNNEDKGIKEVLWFYGGECEYSIGYSNSSEDNGGKFFQIELRKSDAIEKGAKVSQMHASNIAFRFFKNLTNERKNYKEIRVALVFNDGQKQTFKYFSNELERVEKKLTVVNLVVNLINYDSLGTLLSDNSMFTYNKNELLSNLEKVDSSFGNITEGFRLFGFRNDLMKNGIQILHFSGAIIRDKQSNEFSIDIDWSENSNKLYRLQYKM
jgi:hypothetical protein